MRSLSFAGIGSSSALQIQTEILKALVLCLAHVRSSV
jgi:hypothetical protein